MLMSFDYIFIGLPGAGKTTVLKAITQTPLFIMDDEIKKRLNKLVENPLAREQLTKCATDDDVVNSFCAKWSQQFGQELAIKALLRESFPKHSSAIMKYLGEAQWRELEAALAADLIKQEQQPCAFDLGGSQPLNKTIQLVCRDKRKKFVYLKADHDTICDHLSRIQPDGRPRWQHISNYQAKGDAWKALSQAHREEREAKLQAIADITIDISHLALEEMVLKARVAIAEYELRSLSINDRTDELPSVVPALVHQQRLATTDDRKLVLDGSNANVDTVSTVDEFCFQKHK